MSRCSIFCLCNIFRTGFVHYIWIIRRVLLVQTCHSPVKRKDVLTTKYTIKILTSDSYRCHPVFILVLLGNNWCSNNIEPRLECLVQPQHNLISTIINIPQKAQNICNISCDAIVTYHFYRIQRYNLGTLVSHKTHQLRCLNQCLHLALPLLLLVQTKWSIYRCHKEY